MYEKTLFGWPDLTLANLTAQGTMLALEAQQVMALRLARLAQGGPDAPHEAALMVTEKMQALQESGALLLSAALDGKQHLNVPEIRTTLSQEGACQPAAPVRRGVRLTVFYRKRPGFAIFGN